MKKCIVMKWIKLIKLNYFTHSKFLQWQSILHYTFYYTMQMRIGASFAVFSIVSVGFGHWLSLLLCYAFIRPAAIFVFHYSFTRQLYKSSPYSLSHFFFVNPLLVANNSIWDKLPLCSPVLLAGIVHVHSTNSFLFALPCIFFILIFHSGGSFIGWLA